MEIIKRLGIASVPKAEGQDKTHMNREWNYYISYGSEVIHPQGRREASRRDQVNCRQIKKDTVIIWL